MAFVSRMILIATLMLGIARGVFAQTTTSTSETTTTAVQTDTSGHRTGQEVRDDLTTLLREGPTELPTILVLDPTLLSNDAFLGGYPELSQFIAKHPEVRRNPRFYLGAFSAPRDRRLLEDFMEGVTIFATFLLVALALAWLLRTIIEQKRWTRLSRTQMEVHNKILDRFGSSEELLAYMKTPAGSKFLESAPIPLHAEAAQSAPMNRIMWSVQLGIVVVAGSIGMMLVSSRFDAETSRGMFAMGAIAFCVGAGFVASAGVSMLLSKRLGLQNAGASDPEAVQ